MDAFELAVADALTRRGCDVFIPHKDRGVDLVVLPSLEKTRALRLQVKGSRTHGDSFLAWYTFDWAHLSEGASITDLWAFVCLVPSRGGVFQPQFMVIRSTELVARLERYHERREGRVDFYLTEYDEHQLVDDRGLSRREIRAGRMIIQADDPRNYSQFWSQRVEDVWAPFTARTASKQEVK